MYFTLRVFFTILSFSKFARCFTALLSITVSVLLYIDNNLQLYKLNVR